MTSEARLGDLLASAGRPTVAYYPPGASHGPRTPGGFEFAWPLQGSVEWTCGPHRVTASPGTLLLVRPGVSDRMVFDSRRPCRLGRADFTLAERRPDALGWPLTRTTGAEDPLRGLTRYLLWLGSHEPPGWRGRVRETLALMLTIFVDGPLPGTGGTTADPPAALEPVLDHVRAAWSAGPLRPLSRTELARAGAMSPGHLSRVFREYCGIGAVASFEYLRLMRAETLLRASAMSVREIAAACGFADPYHFSHRFKAAYGVAPRPYREGVPATRTPPDGHAGIRMLAHRIWGAAGPSAVPAPRAGT